MRISELFRLVWLNINQNKFKSVMTSIGIVVGAATIVMVIGIGRGGQMDIADQFAELNAGAIDVSYEYAGEEAASGKSGGFFTGGMMNAVFGRMMGGGQGGTDPAGSRGNSGGAGADGQTVVQARRKCQVEVTVATGCKDRMTVMRKRYRGQMDRIVMERMQMKPNLRPA